MALEASGDRGISPLSVTPSSSDEFAPVDVATDLLLRSVNEEDLLRCADISGGDPLSVSTMVGHTGLAMCKPFVKTAVAFSLKTLIVANMEPDASRTGPRGQYNIGTGKRDLQHTEQYVWHVSAKS
jgi:hypothetical protein